MNCRGTGLLVATALLGAGCRLFSSATPPPPARGVVLILADGFGADEGTPELAKLAAAGRSFDGAFAPEPEPAEARAAILQQEGPSIAALFRARGAAVAVLGTAHAVPFDTTPLDFHLPGRVDDAATQARLEKWLRVQTGRFLLVAAAGGEPGPRPNAPSPFSDGQLAPALPRIAGSDLDYADRGGQLLRPPAWSEYARRRAETEHLERSLVADRALGHLLTLIRRAAPGTAVVVVGDPSGDLGAHGMLARPALFDDTLRSALVVATPGLAQPGRAARPTVSTLDVAPTLLDLVGLPPAVELRGRSLMSLLADPSASVPSESLSSVGRRTGGIGRSARSERWRYTEWPDGSTELYDHDADPGEHVNLALHPEEHRTTMEEMARVFEERTSEPRQAPASGASLGSAKPAAIRKVLVIVVDDLTTRVGAWGAPVRTPNIDRLAARGVRFDRAYVQVAMCAPSRGSIFTGWRPQRAGVWNNLGMPRPDGVTPIQELFAAHGAVTATVGKVYPDPTGLRWDVSDEDRRGAGDTHDERGEDADGSETAGSLWVRAAGGDLDQPDGQRARRGAALLGQYRGRPFFVAVGFVRPHLRWIAPARYFDLYPPESIAPEPFPADDLADVPAIAVKNEPQDLPGLALLGRKPNGLFPDPGFRRQAIAAYQACTTFADVQVGVLLDTLERLDLWKDTVVVLFGDNGFHLGDHGGLLGKDTLFEEALRVPLIVAAPGLPRPGSVVRAPVELLDLYPTLVELAGIPAEAGLDGRSLVPFLADPDRPGRGPAVSYRHVTPPPRAWSIRTETARYTLWPDGSEELYDRRSKGAEALNLAGRPERAREKARLRARLEALVAPLPEER